LFNKTPKTIKTLSQYLTEIDRLSKKGLCWFRGQSYHKKYQLTPSFYRTIYNYTVELEEQFLNKFSSRSIPFMQKVPDSEWEWLFIMQHYNTPTRLLDWSESPLTALFFALEGNWVENSSDPTDTPVIWVLNPILLNNKFQGYDEKYQIPNIVSEQEIGQNIRSYYGFTQMYPPDYPIAIMGPSNNVRISAQRGVFTIFPPNKKINLEETEDCNDFLHQIVIDPTKIDEIKKQLFNLGITYNSIYPSLDSVSEDIKTEYELNK
jgi:hypothetical protein